ncbi:MAG: precorrin-3B C(17)-methyltransferase, partial [Verrucomicrobiota bacterium]
HVMTEKKGKLYLVSVGPGYQDYIVPSARKALESSDVIVAYDLYLSWVQDWVRDKKLITLPLTQEIERANAAIAEARRGKSVSLVSSGDIGVYAMGGLAYEQMDAQEPFAVELIPGISAANSCASLLGAPLTHDFATLSLSDLLCPWEWIKTRATNLAQADMVMALYNVQSQKRQEGVYQILKILLQYKDPHTWCGIVRNAYREEQHVDICLLEDLPKKKFDMLTCLIIGNRNTCEKDGKIYTLRGYNPIPGLDETYHHLPEDAVWVFSGTRDGNALAGEIFQRESDVVVSTATEYGKENLLHDFPGIKVCAGRIGQQKRTELLQDKKARMIVDATHPYATVISTQLMEIAQQLELPYIRFERKRSTCSTAYTFNTAEALADAVTQKGGNILLSVGSRQLEPFLNHPDAQDCRWYLRIAPDASSLQKAISLGLPHAQILAMQGPFTKEFNVALMKQWNITALVTKDSGVEGGFEEKVLAAQELGVGLYILDRPEMKYSRVTCEPEEIYDFIKAYGVHLAAVKT